MQVLFRYGSLAPSPVGPWGGKREGREGERKGREGPYTPPVANSWLRHWGEGTHTRPTKAREGQQTTTKDQGPRRCSREGARGG